jgi:putative ABC transport system ATP-binding protein
MSNANPLVAMQGVVKEYHLGKTVVPALNGVDLDVRRGEFTVVMGP